MESPPRQYRYLCEIGFADLTDFCSGWKVTQVRESSEFKSLSTFLRHCYRAGWTPHYLAEGLHRTLDWPRRRVRKDPFSSEEWEPLWKLLDTGDPCMHPQAAVFFYLLRYTGMGITNLVTLSKSRVEGDKIMTYRLNSGSEVWTLVPEWVARKLATCADNAGLYFFWDGHGDPPVERWAKRARMVFAKAGLPSRQPHHFRHHFAIEQLLHGTPVDEVARLLGYNSVAPMLRSYSGWVEQTQQRLEQHQHRVWEGDALHRRMREQQSQESS